MSETVAHSAPDRAAAAPGGAPEALRAPAMETRAGGPGAFARFDLSRVPSPCFVVDAAAVERNLATLRAVADRGGATVLLALKAFSMWRLGDLVGRHLHGTCASGLWEARLARDQFPGLVSTYGAGYKAEDLAEILRISDHVTFNTPAQLRRFRALIEARAEAARAVGMAPPEIGLRINPEHSEGSVPRYDPAQPHSRLGTPVSQLTAEDLDGVDGIHFHTLCEQDLPPLERTWAAIRPFVLRHRERLRWINLGGGHHVTRADYDRDGLASLLREIARETGLRVYLEPGEAAALDAGILVGEVLDVLWNGMAVAVLDVSATCHMPDVIEAPYRPALLGEPQDGALVRLGGPSCLAGDVIGDYRFPATPAPGDRVAFLDQAHYSMVKTTTFNGVPLPAIALWDSRTDALEIVRSFGDETFRERLS